MPPLPVIGGDDLVAALAKIGYLPSRQKGSHVRLLAAIRPPLTVPMQKTLA